MGVNTVPRFIEQPQTWKTRVSVANANIGGNTGTLATLLTGETPHGSKVDYFLFQAQSATQINKLRMYLFTSGGTPHFFKEINISSNSAPATTKSAWSGSYTPAVPIVVPGGWTLQCSIHSANTINIIGFGGDY